ncbi:glycosyltransferase family 4 protein, partial [Halorussus sp. GCM10023401]
PVGGPDSHADVRPAEYRVNPLQQLRREGLRYNPIRNRRNRQTINRYTELGVGVSDALRTALRANGLDCGETVRNGVDAAAVTDAGDPAAFWERYGLDGPFALFGGRTSYNKGGAHLGRAFGSIADEVPDAKLVVTGDGEYVDRMRELADAAGSDEGSETASDRVVSTGWIPREELCAALRAATVVATPSVHLDPFPTLNLEAFAAGTPVVTSTFGGADELVTDGEDGHVVNPFDVPALADRLRELLADPGRAAALGERGRRKVRREFTVAEQVETYLALLDSLVEE